MSGYRIKFTILVIVAILLWPVAIVSADTWRLEQGKDLKSVSPGSQDKFLLKVAEIKKLMNTGKIRVVRSAYNRLKMEFPDIDGPDLDAFIEAELFFCQGNFTKAVRAYDKLLNEFPQSWLVEAAMGRQYEIATACLTGQKKRVLRFFELSRYSEGVKIMEKITTRAGLDSQIGLKAALALTKSYEKRKKFNEAYLKWWEISQQWQTDPIARDAIAAMARCKYAVYNKRNNENRRHLFDTSTLVTSKSYYNKLKSLYPQDAEEIGVDEIIKDIDEQLALKQLSIAQYYQRTKNIQAANLYYDMVIRHSPDSQAAKMAEQITNRGLGSEQTKK